MLDGNTDCAAIVDTVEVIGAGGWATGIDDPAADGTLLIRLDTGVAHSLAPGASSWVREVIAGVTIAAADVVTDLDTNTYDGAIARSNSAVRYLATMGYVLVKKPGASLYTRTALPRRTSMNANSANRMVGKPVKVDPINPAVCIVGFDEGAFLTANYGDNWTTISTSSLPVPTTAGHRWIFAFDRSSATTGGKTQRIYAFSPGNGLYVSNDAGSTWAKVTGAGNPTSAGCMKVHPTTGRVILTGLNTGNTGPVNIWNGSAWSTGSTNLFTVEFHPTIANLVYGAEDGGAFKTSLDNGATWSSGGSPTQTAETVDITWHVHDGTGLVNYRSLGGMVFNETDGYLYFSAGVGVWRHQSPPTTAVTSSFIWHGKSRGIENMVTQGAVRAPDGKSAIVMQDKQVMFFRPGQIGRSFTDNYGPRRGLIRSGLSADYAPEDTDFWVVSHVPGEGESGLAYTADFGKTFTHVNTLAAANGSFGFGQVCVISKDVWIVAPVVKGEPATTAVAANKQANALRITRDRGATWDELVIGNGNAVFGQRYSFFSPDTRKIFAKEPAVGGVTNVLFYNVANTFDTNGADSVACKGTWKIPVDVNSSAVPTPVRTNPNRQFDGFSREWYEFRLNYAGVPGHYLMCCGTDAVGGYRTTNYGATWTPLAGTDTSGLSTVSFGEIFGLSAGAKAPGSANLSIWALGYRLTAGSVPHYGLWESRDNGATWRREQQFPGGHLKKNDDCQASLHKYRDLIATTRGQGAVYLGRRHEIAAF